MTGRVSGVLFACVLLLQTVPAMAEPLDKAACIAAVDRAQKRESQKLLVSARADFVACASDTCPAAIREDCARSLLAVDAALPTVVFSAVADGGGDATDVSVTIDGVQVLSQLDGKALALDPGPHAVRFQRRGGRVVEMQVVAREGEKARVIQISFKTEDTASAPPPVAPAPLSVATAPVTKLDSPKERAPVPVVPVGLGVLGAVGLGTALVLRLNASAEADNLRNTCAPACDPGARDALSDRIVLSNVALGLGLSLLAGAAVTWLLSPGRGPTANAAAKVFVR